MPLTNIADSNVRAGLRWQGEKAEKLSKDAAALSARVSSLESSVNELRAAIAQLKDKINTLTPNL